MKSLATTILFLFVASLAAPSRAQQPTPGSTYVLKAARMFDGKALTKPGLVVVSAGKIVG